MRLCDSDLEVVFVEKEVDIKHFIETLVLRKELYVLDFKTSTVLDLVHATNRKLFSTLDRYDVPEKFMNIDTISKCNDFVYYVYNGNLYACK